MNKKNTGMIVWADRKDAYRFQKEQLIFQKIHEDFRTALDLYDSKHIDAHALNKVAGLHGEAFKHYNDEKEKFLRLAYDADEIKLFKMARGD